MADMDALGEAAAKLSNTITEIETNIEKHIKDMKSREQLVDEIEKLKEERDRLRAELENERNRTGNLETTNAEVANRIDSAIDSIKSILGAT